MSSYPTYEEWKLSFTSFTTGFEISSYPTYEEWKRLSIFSFCLATSVLILPMRNGNLRTGTKKRMKHKMVLILPMRNGNKTRGEKVSRSFEVLILPMRNGNCSITISSMYLK